jgi:YHS domain-containing protein
MFRKSLVITVFVLVGFSTAALGGMMGCACCMIGMKAMEKIAGSGWMKSMEGMAGMGKEEMAQQPLTEGRKKVGEEFTCPVDGMRMQVTEHTPTTEYQGTVYYFCDEADKQTFLKDPERYATGKSAE